jgi:ABC-type antimicrobial peptide transport system permease subunit
VEEQARGSNADVQVTDATTLEGLISTTMVREKLLATSGGVFGTLGLVLTAIGLFASLSYSVARRRREIGIRAALGARPRTLVALVLKESFGLLAVGLAFGFAGSMAVMGAIRSQLFGIVVGEPAVTAGAALVFLVVTALATVVPAIRAASVDPLVALRLE